MPLEKIHKVFKLLEKHIHEHYNDDVCAVLDLFFPEWERDLKDQLDQAKTELAAAKREAEARRRGLEAWGSELERRINLEKQAFERAARLKKSNPVRYQKYRASLDAVMRPKTDYRQALREVKRLEKITKAKTAVLVRCGKVRKVFNENKVFNYIRAYKA